MFHVPHLRATVVSIVAGFSWFGRALTLGLVGGKKSSGPVAPGPVTTLGGGRRRPPGVQPDGQAVSRADLAAHQVAATTPPDASAAASAGAAGAQYASARTRRRAQAGNAGRSGGAPSLSQVGSYGTGASRSLLGS